MLQVEQSQNYFGINRHGVGPPKLVLLWRFSSRRVKHQACAYISVKIRQIHTHSVYGTRASNSRRTWGRFGPRVFKVGYPARALLINIRRKSTPLLRVYHLIQTQIIDSAASPAAANHAGLWERAGDDERRRSLESRFSYTIILIIYFLLY